MTFRPQSFEDVIGLDDVKQIIKYDVEGPLMRGDKLPNFIIDSPPGLGKTTVARLIARSLGGEIHSLMGADLSKEDDVYNLYNQVKQHDAVFIEEAHGISRKAAVALLPWMEEGKLIGDPGDKDNPPPDVSFLFATTNSGKLSDALRNRCQVINISYYSQAELAKIIFQAAQKLGMDLSSDADGLNLLAQSSRGTPRIALEQRLSRVLNVMAVDKVPFSLGLVKRILVSNNINEYGLEKNDLIYCRAIYSLMQDSGGHPAAFKSVCQMTGFAEDVANRVVESYLIRAGIIRIATKGRVLTPLGIKMLGESEVFSQKSLEGTEKNDLPGLLLRIDNKQIRTVQDVCSYLNTTDRSYASSVLNQLGYTSIQKAGICKRIGKPFFTKELYDNRRNQLG